MAGAIAMAGLGWVVSPVVKDLVNRSISYLGSDITRGLEDLETTLMPQFQLTIEAAQHSPRKAQLNRWLARLKNAYFDAEAILHELEYKNLKRKAKGKDKKLLVRLSSKPIIKPIVKFFSHVHLSSKPIIKPLVKFKSHVHLSSKPLVKPLAKFADRAVKKASLLCPQKRKLLKRLNRLKEIASEAKDFRDLLAIQNTGIIQNASNNNFVTTSILGNADKVFGRDGDREDIVNFLLNEQGGSNFTKRYSIVAVTGMGGAGKTTLAQYVYNDPRVQNYFDVKMWICLHQNFDIIEATKDIIECASGKRPKLCNLNNLQEELVNRLSDNKKVMVVLDDIWYDNNGGAAEKKKWENLLKPFDFRGGGGICKIVVTSRSSWSFPIELQPEKHIQLRDLAPDDFKSLLRYRAIDDDLQFTNPQVMNDFIDIVDKIAQKISKLPLAAKVVGNHLRERPDITFWHATLEKVNLRDITEILLWSFHRFDVQLQRCFLFCSIFPKGARFNSQILVPYWVALDFISPTGENRNVDDIGLEYFQKMVANSIFHLVDKMYIMHDLFHDLAKELSVEDCFMAIDAEKKIPEREIPSTVQHVFLRVTNENQKENLSSISNLINLRTLILENPFINDISEIILKISTSFRNLRVLVIDFNPFQNYKTLPRVVGNCTNLRLLYFGNISIEELPDSILQLYHLQFLGLPLSVKTLPMKFSNLIKLRSIIMYSRFRDNYTKSFPPVPYLSKLTSLQHLDEFHVRKEQGYELHQLGPLNQIGGSLRLVNLENVRGKDEAVEASLIEKSKLKTLELVWVESAEINGIEREVIEALRPPLNLKGLTIRGYKGSTFPNWLQEGSATFSENLTVLEIIKCPYLIFVCENELQINENPSSFEQFVTMSGRCFEDVWARDVRAFKHVLDHELRSFEQTGSMENCVEQLQIIKSAAEELWVNVTRAWWCCHQQRMNFIFSLPPERARKNKLKLPSMLSVLSLGYCCISDEALSGCLRGITTLEELNLEGIMTITTFPPSQVVESLQCLQVVKIKHCLYLRSLGGLHALPHLGHFEVHDCWCLEMESSHTPLPPTLQSFAIATCVVPQAIFNSDLPCLEDVKIFACHVPSSLSFHQLTMLQTLTLSDCYDLRIISGLQSCHTLKEIHLRECLQLSKLPELPRSVQHISLENCPVLMERCQPNGPDWHIIQDIEYKSIH